MHEFPFTEVLLHNFSVRPPPMASEKRQSGDEPRIPMAVVCTADGGRELGGLYFVGRGGGDMQEFPPQGRRSPSNPGSQKYGGLARGEVGSAGLVSQGPHTT
ncbi:hypothetical protein GOP47_0015194, partial [Adiantum capillus-veneris]